MSTTNPSQNNITTTEEKYHRIVTVEQSLKTMQYKIACFFFPNPHWIWLSEDLVTRSSELFEMPAIRVQYSLKLSPDTKCQSEILYMTGKFRTYVNPTYCVDYRNGPRYCCQRSIGWGRGDQTVYPQENVFAYLVVLRFKTRCPKTNTVAPLNSKCIALQKNFGLATLLQRSAFLWLL